MGKRIWKVEWVAQPRSDGVDRLSQAMKLLLNRAGDSGAARASPMEQVQDEDVREEVNR